MAAGIDDTAARTPAFHKRIPEALTAWIAAAKAWPATIRYANDALILATLKLVFPGAD